MILLVLFVLLGIFVGNALPLHIPDVSARYFAVALLAALDSLLGAGKSVFENRFNLLHFVSGFIINTLLAGFLTYIGDRLGVELYLAAIITFGVRIFQDLSMIRVFVLKRFSPNHPQGIPKNKSKLVL